MKECIILKTCELTKIFPGVKALDSINLEIKRGEVHALLGENGAGKSTLAKVIAGIYQRDGGDIFHNGCKRDFDSPMEAFNSGISVIHQENSLIQQLSVLENIFLGIEDIKVFSFSINTAELLNRYKVLQNKLNSFLDPNKNVRELNVAEQKMVEILKALAHNSEFLIMDEPTDALTEKEIIQLFRIIEDLKKDNITILYITHYLDEVFKIADSLTVLRDGKKISTKKTSMTNKKDVIKMMVGHEIKIQVYKANPIKSSAIRVDNLSKTGVVKNINFTAYYGEVLGITGLIGSGKTELARLIFGADRADSGEVFINNKAVKIKTPVQARKHGIGMVPEDRRRYGLFLNHESYKNITISSLDQYISWCILSRKEEIDAARNMIAKLEIKLSSPLQLAKNASGGNQQKIIIAKWLATDLKILIMDEPTRGIDINSKNEIYKIIRNMAKEGKSVIFISSEVPEVIEIADRILILKDGKISAEYKHGVTTKKVMQHILKGKE